MKKVYIFVSIIVVATVLVIGGLYLKSNSKTEVQAPAIKGEVACLPLKNPNEGSNDTMCMKGIKNEAGLYLEVHTLSQERLELGKTVEVKGAVTPPDANSKYQTAGAIVHK